MSRSSSESDVTSAGVKVLRESLYHCWPGQVIAFYASTETIDVQPMVNDLRWDLVTGVRVSEPWPVFYGVKVAWPKFGGFELVGPMAPGDGVILTAFDIDPTAYFQTGNRSDPAHAARHTGAYWRASPANLTNAGVSPDAAAASSAMIVGAAGKAAQIRFDGTFIQLGASGGDFVALASKVQQAIADLAAWVKTGQAPSGTSGGPVTYASPAPTDSVGSTLIKAQ